MAATVVAAAALLLAAVLLRVSRGQQPSVPQVPGLPVLGNTIALARGGVAFISQCRQRVSELEGLWQRPCAQHTPE